MSSRQSSEVFNRLRKYEARIREQDEVTKGLVTMIAHLSAALTGVCEGMPEQTAVFTEERFRALFADAASEKCVMSFQRADGTMRVCAVDGEKARAAVEAK